MDEKFYNKDTIDAKLEQIHDSIKSVGGKVDIMDAKVTYTNGKVKSLTKILLIVASVTGTLLVSSGSELVKFIMSIIK